MIIQGIIPQSDEITIKIPTNLVGKEIDIDIKATKKKATKTKKPSDFIGKFSTNKANQLQRQLKKVRQEWERNI